MSVDLTSWLQALQAWQNSGHTESGWEDGPTVVWPLVVMLGLALLYAFLSFVLKTTVAENAEVIVSVGGFFLVVYAFTHGRTRRSAFRPNWNKRSTSA